MAKIRPEELDKWLNEDRPFKKKKIKKFKKNDE